jgi:hypothetical protein
MTMAKGYSNEKVLFHYSGTGLFILESYIVIANLFLEFVLELPESVSKTSVY